MFSVMLGETVVLNAEIRTEIGRGLLCVQHTPVLPAVDEHSHAAAVLLHRAITVCIIPIVRHITILGDGRQAVLLIPAEPLLTGTLNCIWLHGHARLHS